MRFRLLAVNAALASALCAQQTSVPKSPDDFKQMGDRTGKLKPGDMAPDFDLKVMHKETKVVLSSFRNKLPVALVFGSYT